MNLLKIFSLILLLSIPTFSEVLFEYGLSYDPTTSKYPQLGLGMGSIKDIAFEGNLSLDLYLKIPFKNFSNPNLQIPIFFYLNRYCITGGIQLNNFKTDQWKEFNSLFEKSYFIGIGAMYEFEKLFKPSILYNLQEEKLQITIQIIIITEMLLY